MMNTKFINWSDYEDFSHQVAGHKSYKILKSKNDEVILKPLLKPDLSKREIDFYETLPIKYLKSPIFRTFIPNNYGFTIADNTNNSNVIIGQKLYLILENLSKHLNTPSIIDIKIGRQTYEPGASPEKIDNEISKYPLQSHFGYRISGMKIYDRNKSNYKYIEKDFCHKVNPQDLLYIFGFYVFDGLNFQKEVLKVIIDKLEALYDCFHTESIYHNFYSSSLLILYDSTLVNKCDSGIDIKDMVKVYMIDFAHVIESNKEIDVNYIHGLKNVIDILRNIHTILDKGDESFIDFKSKVIERFYL
jgi:1D-myo-inositol-tetrakisphosphate 5-kinase/inositol-polyphosphate multikinase